MASGDQIPLLICGDLNSSPGSPVHSLINSGQLAKAHPELDGRLYGRYQKHGMVHPFKLRSTYGAIGELSFTNYTPDFKDILDYMWYTTNTLHVSALLGEVDKDYLSRVPGFPNFHFPSDHVALFAEFTVRGKRARLWKRTLDRNDTEWQEYFESFEKGVCLVWFLFSFSHFLYCYLGIFGAVGSYLAVFIALSLLFLSFLLSFLHRDYEVVSFPSSVLLSSISCYAVKNISSRYVDW
jgi:mRNA deadenylase, exonuclease subunit and related nucleases